MNDYSVTRFNVVCGNPPAQNVSSFWLKVQRQLDYLKEEVLEGIDAAQDGVRDPVELVDAICDIRYLADYLETLADNMKIDVMGAYDAVCKNNDQKFTTDKTLAIQTLAHYEDVLCTIVETEYDGQIYYTVRRFYDGKVMKLKGHTPPDLTPFVSEFGDK